MKKNAEDWHQYHVHCSDKACLSDGCVFYAELLQAARRKKTYAAAYASYDYYFVVCYFIDKRFVTYDTCVIFLCFFVCYHDVWYEHENCQNVARSRKGERLHVIHADALRNKAQPPNTCRKEQD